MGSEGLSKTFLAERDVQIFNMKRAGVSSAEIARRFGISTGAVTASVRRQLERLNREAIGAYPELLRLELERLDALQQSLWPMTQHRRVTAPDGSEIPVEPDARVVQTVLGIMDRRSRLLGMDTVNVNLFDQGSGGAQRAVLSGAERPAEVDAFDPEAEAKELIRLMSEAGVLPQGVEKLLLDDRRPLEAGETEDESDENDGN